MNNSYVREWIANYEDNVKSGKPNKNKVLFINLIESLIEFPFYQNEEIITEKGDEEKDFSSTYKEFMGDNCLLELSCYFYFRIDLFLFTIKSNIREELSNYLLRHIHEIFNQALQVDSLDKLIKRRVDKYGELTRTTDDIQPHHAILEILLLKSSLNNSIYEGELGTMALKLDELSFIKRTFIKIVLVHFEEKVINPYLLNLKKYA